MIGPPPNPDHDRSDPLPHPILEGTHARPPNCRRTRAQFPRAHGVADFSRTFVEVSNDHREVAARPKRQLSQGGRDLTASKRRIASLTFRGVFSNLLIFFIIWIAMPAGSPAPPSRVVRPWGEVPRPGVDFRAASPQASAKPMKDRGDYHP
jgi:hypothetical protein